MISLSLSLSLSLLPKYDAGQRAHFRATRGRDSRSSVSSSRSNSSSNIYTGVRRGREENEGVRHEVNYEGEGPVQRAGGSERTARTRKKRRRKRARGGTFRRVRLNVETLYISLFLSLSLSFSRASDIGRLCVRWPLHPGRHFLSASQLSEDLHKRLFMIALLFVGRRADPVVPPSLPPSRPSFLRRAYPSRSFD